MHCHARAAGTDGSSTAVVNNGRFPEPESRCAAGSPYLKQLHGEGVHVGPVGLPVLCLCCCFQQRQQQTSAGPVLKSKRSDLAAWLLRESGHTRSRNTLLYTLQWLYSCTGFDGWVFDHHNSWESQMPIDSKQQKSKLKSKLS